MKSFRPSLGGTVIGNEGPLGGRGGIRRPKGTTWWEESLILTENYLLGKFKRSFFLKVKDLRSQIVKEVCLVLRYAIYLPVSIIVLVFKKKENLARYSTESVCGILSERYRSEQWQFEA